ncbi:MAG: DEAD/DEAH box helicase [Nitrospirae bacterium]|nr:DEAD/DEAH box helicase [Nitrospirota bacterium]
MNELKNAFNILKKEFPDYEHRPQQMEMAEAVLDCLSEKKDLLVEAGTGVGKSFAYLIPAILSGEKTVISTATITLQDQLVNRDLVFLRKVMPQKFSFAILKGKNNYLCLKRAREFQPELSKEHKIFLEWASETDTGDRDGLPFIPEFWGKVCGDSDDCNVNQCPSYSDCFYYSHYKGLYRKDILVVNHHVLMLDALSGFNFLPFHGQLIIDEAHQLEDVISAVFGNVLSHSRLAWLLYRLKGLKLSVEHIFEDVNKFFTLPSIPPLDKGGHRGVKAVKGGNGIPDSVIDSLKNLNSQFAFDKIIKRLNSSSDSAPDDETRDRITTTISYINSLGTVIDDFIGQADEDKVYYMSRDKKGIELRSNLVEVRAPFKGLSDAYDSIVMTSATLTAGKNFGFIKERLGLADFREMIVGSPFDYRKQALLYLDRELPPPVRENSGLFQHSSLGVIEALINASAGRALVLFTSYSHLNFVRDNISLKYPVKFQGEMPPARLIEWFREADNPVLLATATFWQGIDIKGDKLSLVIIVKMPFGSPGDPVYDERCRRLGERWFSDLALPSAVLLLRQGFGRLIRSADDYGLVAILDARLMKSSYGSAVIASLPEMDIVHDIKDVKRFFAAKNKIVDNARKNGYNETLRVNIK